MPGMFEIGGDATKIASLATDQATHHGKFTGIVEQIKTNVATVIGAWDGAGQVDHKALMDKYGTEFTMMQDALNRMKAATDDAGNEISTLGANLVRTFSA
ncbi:WXG100 family type VII secretion target [Phytomonospora sp. NPDC050363]|uniref:WXG100 family type VII secretion target n=1 Tax=Phytomonospora sp. NPDC050363 TaxID=3155642 RepID=UPI0033F275FC